MFTKTRKALYVLICCMAAAVLLVGCQGQIGSLNVNNVNENHAAEVNTNEGGTKDPASNNTVEPDNNNTAESANNASNTEPANNTSDSKSANTNNSSDPDPANTNNTSDPDPANTNNISDPEPAADPTADFRSSHNEVARTEKYTLYELSFEREGLTIYGQLYLPNAELSRYPLVITSHGFEGSFRLNTYINESFANAGFAVYAFDFCGGSTYSLSSGNMLDMSVLTEKEDLNAVFDGLISMEFIDENKIFLMGESQGGMVSALVASERPDDVAGMVLFYPAFVIPDNGRAFYGTKENIPEYAYAFTLTVGRRYYLDTIEMDPFEEIKGYEGDVLLIHGDQDTVVPYYYSQKAHETYKNSELITLYGASHGFVGQYLVDACNASVSFINDHLK